ncbi:LOW QUALITY PROTEIN: Hypothetical protein PHPALM_10802 [Phytophthora palmivora]|uniref:Uncharacterized protein n=1 Tax=Phytophthora palmivora TaxID=4796 RepID=A0A2P4Y3T2_9STRA|nr:LOW QUALITY PROTEIN: Hypothetical protein PHPALM_10802 [Phytophthora palmivora]
MKEHAAFLAGNQEHDVDFGDDIPLQPARIPRMKLVPTGKDVAYLRAQKRTISEHAVAAKTLAGSGRKTLNRRKAKSVHEEFVSEEESDDEEEDQDYEDEEELEEAPPKVGKGKAMAKPKSKPRKTRNPTAAQLAEEAKE